jgi:hypothetical protein
MALVVAVHGIGHQRTGANTIHKDWFPALNDGLDTVPHPRLSADTFAVAYYGDLFRPKGTMSVDTPPLDARDVTDPWEIALLDAIWREAATTDAAVLGPNRETMIAVPTIVQRALDALSQSRFFSGIAERALIFDLKQVRAYLHDDSVRQTAMDRVAKAIGPDTQILIGHSLGSIVAYEALCQHPHWSVTTFITLGSPLGIRNLVFERLRPAPANGVGAPPGSVKQWVNVSDKGDPVALTKRLNPLFGGIVSDHSVSNGASAHDARPYLTSHEVGLAVASGLQTQRDG